LLQNPGCAQPSTSSFNSSQKRETVNQSPVVSFDKPPPHKRFHDVPPLQLTKMESILSGQKKEESKMNSESNPSVHENKSCENEQKYYDPTEQSDSAFPKVDDLDSAQFEELLRKQLEKEFEESSSGHHNNNRNSPVSVDNPSIPSKKGRPQREMKALARSYPEDKIGTKLIPFKGGYCHRYNTPDNFCSRETKGKPCPYKHLCVFCDESHPGHQHNFVKRPKPNKNKNSDTTTSPWKFGYCLKYNKQDASCPNRSACQWKHACTICDGKHPHFRHQQQQPQQQQQQSSFKSRNTNPDRATQGNANGVQR